MAAAFTLGSMNSQELTFQDNLILTGYRKELTGMLEGTSPYPWNLAWT